MNPVLACRRDLLDISSFVQDAAAAIVDDSFLRCFQSQSSDPWNWNIYLAPLWLIGLVVRYLILFPLRWMPFMRLSLTEETLSGHCHSVRPSALKPLVSPFQPCPGIISVLSREGVERKV